MAALFAFHAVRTLASVVSRSRWFLGLLVPCYLRHAVRLVSFSVLSRFLLPCCRSFVFSHFGRYIYIGGMLVRFLPLRRVTATEFLVGALPALVFVYLLVRDQNWPRLNPMSFGFPCSKFPVFVSRVPISLIILSSFHLVRHASISVSSVDVIFPV